MNTCSYCGRKSEETATRCRECGKPFALEPALPLPQGPSFSFLPRSREEWTRSLAWPLLIGCLCILASALGVEGRSRVWRYAGPDIAGRLLPLLGALLAITCLSGKGLRRRFLIFALIVAFLSIAGGLLSPALAE